VCGGLQETADGDHAQALALGGSEDGGESLDAGGWVGYTVVEDDDCAGGEIFGDEPADIPDWRAQGIVRVGGAEDALVAVGSGETQVARAGCAAGRAEELG